MLYWANINANMVPSRISGALFLERTRPVEVVLAAGGTCVPASLGSGALPRVRWPGTERRPLYVSGGGPVSFARVCWGVGVSSGTESPGGRAATGQQPGLDRMFQGVAPPWAWPEAFSSLSPPSSLSSPCQYSFLGPGGEPARISQQVDLGNPGRAASPSQEDPVRLLWAKVEVLKFHPGALGTGFALTTSGWTPRIPQCPRPPTTALLMFSHHLRCPGTQGWVSPRPPEARQLTLSCPAEVDFHFLALSHRADTQPHGDRNRTNALIPVFLRRK